MANNNTYDLNLIKEAIVRLLDGTYKGPIPFGVDSKNVEHNSYTLEELLGYGLNPNIDGNITEQLAALRGTISNILMEQLQNAGIGKLYTTKDYLGNETKKIYVKTVYTTDTEGNKNEIPEEGNAGNNVNSAYANITITDPWGSIEVLDLLSSDMTGNLFLITSIEENDNKENYPEADFVLRVEFITTIVTSILGRLPDKEDHTNKLDEVKRSGSVKLSKYDIDLDKIENKLYLPLVGAGARLEGDLIIGKKKEGSSAYDYLYKDEDSYGEEEFSGNLVVEGALSVDEDVHIKGNLIVEGKSITLDSETLRVRDNLIETNVGNDYLFGYSGLAINTGERDEEDNNYAYGIVYDPIEDTVKLGLGKINQEGVFDFEFDENGNTQGLSVVVRDKDLKDGVLLKWDEENHKIVSIAADEITADMIYFTKDITLAGNYTQVGNVTKTNANTSVEDGLKAKGRTVEQILTEIFTKVLQPTTITQPSVSGFTLSQAGTVEAGTKYNTLNFSGARLDPGSYQYGPATGIVAKSWRIDRICTPSSLSQTGIAATTSGSDNNNGNGFIIGDKGGDNVVSSIKYEAIAEYNEGAIAWNNIGGNSDPEIRIQEGSKSKTTSTLTSFRKYFYGASAGTPPQGLDITSDFIRNLSNKSSTAYPTSKTFTLTIPSGSTGIYFAFDATKVGITKIMNNNINQDVTDTFTKQTGVQVEGANHYTAINYNVWYYIPSNPFGNQTTFTITLG